MAIQPPVTVLTESERNERGIDVKVYESAVSSYKSTVDLYFRRLNSVGRVNLSLLKIVLYGIGRSLVKFADGSTAIFSEHSKGGGVRSNACLLPHMVQLAVYRMENGSQSGSGLKSTIAHKTRTTTRNNTVNNVTAGANKKTSTST